MKKYTFRIIGLLMTFFVSGCAAKSSTKGLIVLNRCYKLIREHLTEDKPELINLDTLKEWNVCDVNLYNHEDTRIKSDGAKTITLSLADLDGNKQSYTCSYELVVDNVGQSGSGYISINDIRYNFYLVDTWALCIEIDDTLAEDGSQRTLEFQLWGC